MMNQEQWQAVAKYLEGLGHTLDLANEPKKLSGGVANFNYVVSLNGKKAVLRRPPDGPLPPGANDVAREYRVLSSLKEHYPPAPVGLVFCDDETVIGVPFCISEFREGICIGRHLPESLSDRPQIGDALSQLVVELLAKLHKVDLKATGLESLGNVEGFLERQIGGWYKRGSRVLSEQQLEKLGTIRDWLQDNLPDKRLGTLVHNDFKLDNMLINEESLTVNGVVDWDMCTVGDPFYELAILLAYWGDQDDEPAYDFQCRMPKEAEGWWPRDKVIEEYFKLTGFEKAGLNFYWWLTQYRNIVVYAQLNALFSRTGEFPAALTQEECELMPERVDQLLEAVTATVGSQDGMKSRPIEAKRKPSGVGPKSKEEIQNA